VSLFLVLKIAADKPEIQSLASILDLLKHDNVVRLLLLSCMQAEISVMSYILQVAGHHLRFTTHPGIEQC